jgi:hypothetical protein
MVLRLTDKKKDLLQHEIEKLDFINLMPSLEKIAKQPSHQYCMLCGTQASAGLQLDFYMAVLLRHYLMPACARPFLIRVSKR